MKIVLVGGRQAGTAAMESKFFFLPSYRLTSYRPTALPPTPNDTP